MNDCNDQDFYHFSPLRNRQGKISLYDERIVDHYDFTVNPRLIQQINFPSCPETTPEGQALWLYVRLCQLLKYDEGYFYRNSRAHPNDDPNWSLTIADQITAETPVTCFNFSRIAVKLLNQIQGVHALMIAVGSDHGHYRFGYYTDKVSVDAEATASYEYNDLSRIKLGLLPQGLKVFHGAELMAELTEKMVKPMLQEKQPSLGDYLDVLQRLPLQTVQQQIDFRHLVPLLKTNGADGNTMVQVFLHLNSCFAQPPYKLARVAVNKPHYLRNGLMGDTVAPQLLFRENQALTRLDLTSLQLCPLSLELYRYLVQSGNLIYANNHDNGSYSTQFEQDLELGR